MKLVTFASAPEGQAPDAFHRWFLGEYVPALVSAAPSLVGGTVRRRVEVPQMKLAPADPTPGIARSDVMLELWFPTTEDFRREVLPVEKKLKKAGARYISYSIMPRLHKDPRIAEAGPNGARPEITQVVSFKWLPHLSAEMGSAHWQNHTQIALRTQKAMTKYEQNIVIEPISWSAGMSPIDAYGDFSFRTIDEMIKGFVFTQEEFQDVQKWLGPSLITCFSDAAPFGPFAI